MADEFSKMDDTPTIPRPANGRVVTRLRPGGERRTAAIAPPIITSIPSLQYRRPTKWMTPATWPTYDSHHRHALHCHLGHPTNLHSIFTSVMQDTHQRKSTPTTTIFECRTNRMGDDVTYGVEPPYFPYLIPSTQRSTSFGDPFSGAAAAAGDTKPKTCTNYVVALIKMTKKWAWSHRKSS